MYKKLITILLISSLSFSASAEDSKLDDSSVPFLYEANAEIKAPDHKLASLISTDYRKAKDEFTKHDLFQQIKPIIDKRLKEAANTKNVFILVGGKLGEYDFDKKAFKTGFSDTTFIPYKNSYAASFTNAKNIQFLSVPMESARKLSSELRKSRRANFKIIGEIVGADEEQLNYRAKKILRVKITRIEVTLKSGTVVGQKNL